MGEALRRPRSRLEDNIKTDLKEIVWENAEWICYSREISVADSFDHGNEPLG
jgi:hypothetical protein